MPPALHTSAAVYYRASVVDAVTGAEVASLPRKKNLILNQGLDLVAIYRWQDCIRYAVAGTGTTPTRRDSGAVTFARAASTVTASAGFFDAGDVGQLLKFNTGEEMRVTAFTSPTVVTVDTSGTLAASAGTIWAVNQTGLDSEAKRTETYGTAGGDNSVTIDGGTGTLTQRRTFIFSAETGVVTYREIGWAYSGSPGENLFGRDVLPGGGLSLVAGQQLKVVLDLVLSVDPLEPEAADSIPWSGGTAEQQFENIYWDYSFNPQYADNGLTIFLSESSADFITPRVTAHAPGDPLSGTYYAVASTASAYVLGSFERNFYGFFGLNDGNSAAIRSAGWGWLDWTTLYPVQRVKFSTAQTKDSDHTLRLDFRHTWGRVLTN